MSIDFNNTMKDKTKYLSMNEINRILQYCYDKGQMRNYVLIKLLASSGRRITEILGEKPYTRKIGLRPCDIMDNGLIEFDVLKKNHIKIRSSKTGQKLDKDKIKRLRLKKQPKRALFPIDDTTLELLKIYIESQNFTPKQRVFPMTRQNFDLIIKKICKDLGITRSSGKISAHNFRHSFAINILKDNPNDASVLMQLQQLLDHSSLSVTMHYTQFSQEDKKEKLNKLFNRSDE